MIFSPRALATFFIVAVTIMQAAFSLPAGHNLVVRSSPAGKKDKEPIVWNPAFGESTSRVDSPPLDPLEEGTQIEPQAGKQNPPVHKPRRTGNRVQKSSGAQPYGVPKGTGEKNKKEDGTEDISKMLLKTKLG